MKKRLFILMVSGMSCSFVSAQTVFYNQGAVVTKSTDKSKAIVYIKGSLQVGTDAASATTSAIAIERSKVILTGDFINDVARGAAGGRVFTALAASDAGTLEFRGTGNAQNITTSGVTNATIPSKRENFINFPHIEINNDKHVLMNARLAAETKNIDLKEGWLILDSKVADAVKDGNSGTIDKESVLAHLLVQGQIDYHKADWANISAVDAHKRGFIEVRLAIPSDGSSPLNNKRNIAGFGSPFKELGNDYFMFNTILAPSPVGFVGAGPITDPELSLAAGKGYVVGIDLRGTNAALYDEPPYSPSISFDQRAHTGHYFNRHAYATDPSRSANQIFGQDVTAASYQNEVLNTTDVLVPLTKGYNYLSNPYTCPLNIDKLLGDDLAQSTWNIKSGPTSIQPQLFNHVWLMSPNCAASPSDSGNPKRTKYSYNYLVAKKVGGTYDGDYEDGDGLSGVTAIAPLQLFMVHAYSTATSITIPASQRVAGTTRFTRSTPITNQARRDDFILEFKDETTRTSDRVSFVLRSANEITSNPNYKDIKRLESTSSESNNVSKSETKSTTSFKQSLASQIYTKDNAGQPLTVQFLPIETTSSAVLYHTPSTLAQNISIRGLRIPTMDQVQQMWLEDKVQTAYMEITPDMVYKTSSNPNDREDRFVIHFRYTSGIGDIDVDAQNIYAYDSEGTIWVEGFENSDMGNTVQLIDLNGRILASARVNELKLKLSDTHLRGVYIIQMSGSRSQILKLLAH